jgi:hypothetical protein
MFHAELAYKNVEKEIELLKKKQVQRQGALEKSKDELNDD